MTPSIAPNWASTPQNQPKPKVAVSKTDEAAVSMGGSPRGDATCWELIFMVDSSAVEGRLDRDSPEREQDPPQASALNTMILQMTSVPLLFGMANSFLKACRKAGLARCSETECEIVFIP
jgi:hypothetical protein